MCRMLGLISIKPTTASKYLFEDECSLLAQAIKGNQSDGWGIGYYVNGQPQVFKSPNSVEKEVDLFKETCSRITSRIIIAHVRKASNPRRLPRHMLIGIENTQPFHHKDYIFAHNGTIYIPDEVMASLGEYRKLVKGVNDSEVYFAYLVKELESGKDPIEALRAVEKGLWHMLKLSKREKRAPYSSLNAIFSDGHRLYAVTLYREGEKLKSICYRDTEYFRMAYKYEGDRLIIASERTNNEEWYLLHNGELLIAEPAHDRIVYRIVRLVDIH